MQRGSAIGRDLHRHCAVSPYEGKEPGNERIVVLNPLQHGIRENNIIALSPIQFRRIPDYPFPL